MELLAQRYIRWLIASREAITRLYTPGSPDTARWINLFPYLYEMIVVVFNKWRLYLKWGPHCLLQFCLSRLICIGDDMHFVWFSMWDGFFSPWVSESHPSCLQRGCDSETNGEKSISYGKPYKMHFLKYFTVQGTLIMLNTLHKVEDHENHVRWIYLTTVLYVRESQKYARNIRVWYV